MMVHLTEESLSELLDGSPVANAEEHLAGCPACQGELEALRRLRSELRDLPELLPPEESWSRIANQLPAGRRVRRWRRSGMIAVQAVAAAAVFVLGVGLGRVFQPGVSVDDGARLERSAVQPSASLAEAMAEVRKRGVVRCRTSQLGTAGPEGGRAGAFAGAAEVGQSGDVGRSVANGAVS